MKKQQIIVEIISILLVFIYFIMPIFGMESIIEFNSNNTLYVDDDNTKGPWYGTQQFPYKNIQDALNNSFLGDTVIVYSGVYHGYNPFSGLGQIPIVRIDKSISLIGQEINGQGKPLITTCIVIAPNLFGSGTTDYTKIINFCIEYPYNLLYDAIHVGGSSFVEISNCNITAFEEFTGGIQLSNSNYSIIKNNYIYSCHGTGIYVSDSNNNIFLGNTFYNNSGWGGIIFDKFSSGGIERYSNYSIICHNQFIDNGAISKCNNTWYNPFTLTGNYWYNYEGEDKDDDGIGDIPYNISGEGKCQDLYPLMKPWSGSENYPPNKPSINGSSKGQAGEFYDYIFSANDSDGDGIKFLVNWGDGSVEYSEIIPSDSELKISHLFEKKGSYVIKVRAFDLNLDYSDWATLEVSMPKNRMINNPILNFLQQFPLIYQLLQRFLNL